VQRKILRQLAKRVYIMFQKGTSDSYTRTE
jgi:hypothetical protein